MLYKNIQELEYSFICMFKRFRFQKLSSCLVLNQNIKLCISKICVKRKI